jgi:ABC-type transport system involved in multi-copper enzyme maturation permease subunit
MRLIRAELLKIRRRQATYVLFLVLVILMAVIYLLTGGAYDNPFTGGIIEFPGAYAVISQFAFAFGGLFAMVFAAAFVGVDWNWGVLRNVIARGESRANYLLAKAAALAIVLAIALVLVFLLGIALTYLQGAIYGVPVSSPLRGRGLMDLVDWLAFGYPVLLQRAAIGFVVAVLMRSQLAGAVVGIVLFLGESLVTFFLTIFTIGTRFANPDTVFRGFEPAPPQWFQFLPISVGGNVLSQLPGGGGLLSEGGLQGLLIQPVPMVIALPAVFVYLAAALLVAIFALRRQEII